MLTREGDSLQFAAGAFGPPPDPALVDDLANAFRTGTGLPYDRHGPASVHQTERMLGPWARLSLVPTIVPALEGMHDRLAAGTVVADVGCGAAVALTTLAEAYPRSTFHGYELSHLAVERARARVLKCRTHQRGDLRSPGRGAARQRPLTRWCSLSTACTT